MRRQLILRNVICPTANVSPSGFDVRGFAERLDLGSGEPKVRLENVSVTEWEKARIQVLPERLQLGFKEAADRDFVRRVVEDFLDRIDHIAAGRPVGFNAAMLFTLDEGDSDPSKKIVDASALAELLDGTAGRGGVTLVYHDDLSRWWIELSPQPDHDDKWTLDFNRHFKDFPSPGGGRDEVLDWFADVEGSLLAQFETISGGAD